MAEQDLTQRINTRFQELRSLHEQAGAIYSSLNQDYQALLAERAEVKSANPPLVSSSAKVVQSDQSESVNYYSLVSAVSWFSALQNLRRQGSSKTITISGQNYVRPFTLKENLRARIEDYNTLTNPDGTQRTEEERQRFFNTWLDSCTGIHYLARTTRFKIISQSPQLITLAQAPAVNYLPIPYAQSAGREMDNTAGGTKYNQDLTRAEVLEQPAWLAAVEEDRVLLGEVFDVMRAVKNGSADWKGMGFYVYPNKPQDELRPLFVDSHGGDGNANGGNLLGSDGRFLRQ